MRSISAGLAASALFFNGTALWACPQCRPVVNAGVYNQDFGENLFLVLLPLAVLFVIGVGIHFSDAIVVKLRRHKGEKPWQTTHNAGR